jgi:hypothetical protein
MSKTAKKKTEVLEVSTKDGPDLPAAIAKTFLRPTLNASLTVRHALHGRTETMPEVGPLLSELSSQVEATNKGDLSRAEAILISQAHALDSLFASLVHRSYLNMNEYLPAAETFMRLALKAQSQCRATLETLAQIKNPAGVAFVKQANIANGPQQVNNGVAPPSGDPHAREIFPENKLLEQSSGERLDIRTASAPARSDPQMATVEALNRAAHASR